MRCEHTGRISHRSHGSASNAGEANLARPIADRRFFLDYRLDRAAVAPARALVATHSQVRKPRYRFSVRGRQPPDAPARLEHNLRRRLRVGNAGPAATPSSSQCSSTVRDAAPLHTMPRWRPHSPYRTIKPPRNIGPDGEAVAAPRIDARETPGWRLHNRFSTAARQFPVSNAFSAAMIV
jgi:hypothetical protein